MMRKTRQKPKTQRARRNQEEKIRRHKGTNTSIRRDYKYTGS